MKKLKEFILNDTVQEVIAGICFMSLLIGFLLMCLAIG